MDRVGNVSQNMKEQDEKNCSYKYNVQSDHVFVYCARYSKLHHKQYHHCIIIVSSLSHHCLIIVSSLSHHCITIVPPLYHHCLIIVLLLSRHCLVIVSSLSHNCLIIVSLLYHHCTTIVSSLYHHHSLTCSNVSAMPIPTISKCFVENCVLDRAPSSGPQ